MTKLSAVIITRNEEKNIGECLSALHFCDEKIVVDSGSTDQTVKIAADHGAKVVPRPFTNFSEQKNFGIEKACGEWVLLIDADERVSEALSFEIQKTIESAKFDGYFLHRLNCIFGRWMRYGDNKNDFQLRLVRKERAYFKGVVHERIYLNERAGDLKNPLLHYSTETISSYMEKLNHYTVLEAGKSLTLERMARPFWRVTRGGESPTNAKPQLRISGDTERQDPPKWVTGPPGKMMSKPLVLFFYRMFWQKGFLDGIEGIFFCVLSAYYEFLRQAKCWELQTETNK